MTMSDSTGTQTSSTRRQGGTPKKTGTTPTRPQQLRKLLRRKNGATIAQIQTRFGGQPHTARVALSGLRKAGETIERLAGETVAVYRIVPDTADQ